MGVGMGVWGDGFGQGSLGLCSPGNGSRSNRPFSFHPDLAAQKCSFVVTKAVVTTIAPDASGGRGSPVFCVVILPRTAPATMTRGVGFGGGGGGGGGEGVLWVGGGSVVGC